MSHCTLCPRQCPGDRAKAEGFCHAGDEAEVASIALHRGEEPALAGARGICNVFFAHCNLQCVYCQNHEISRREVAGEKIFYRTDADIISRIEEVLEESEQVVGFVSPTHYAHRVAAIVEALHRRGRRPTVVYNTNCYDSIETLRMVEPYVDIYLPDLKYSDAGLAARYSHAADYPERAREALLEMVRQRGTGLLTDEEGLAFRGIIIRHLILPGQLQNTFDTLDWIADNIGTRVHLSLMGQYNPPQAMEAVDELGRRLTQEEYDAAAAHCEQLGFAHGWLQSLEAADCYCPDFSKKDSFEQ